MHKDISIGHTYQSPITSHIQYIKQQSKVFTCYFLPSLLKSGQLITQNQTKQSNSFSAQGLVRPKDLSTYNHIFKSSTIEFYLKVTN